ncbi:MAG TPA: complex I NDUFA9 subunit family protein, partial [Methylibium sp.]
PARAKALAMLPGVELQAADVHDEAQLSAVLRGCEAAVNLVGILHGSEREFQHAHVELPRKLARACASAGVQRLVHVSALGVAADAPSRYLRSKAAGEAVLREEARLDLTILRPSVMFGAEDRFLNLFASLQALFPLLPLAGSEAQFQPVWVEDVAAAITACLTDERPSAGLAIECAGPKVYTLRELVRLAGRWSGHERPVLPLPMPLGRLQAGLMSLLPGEPLMSPDNLDSMRVPNVASGKLPGLSSLGIQATALEAVAPDYLGAQAGPGCGRFDGWRALARRR